MNEKDTTVITATILGFILLITSFWQCNDAHTDVWRLEMKIDSLEYCRSRQIEDARRDILSEIKEQSHIIEHHQSEHQNNLDCIEDISRENREITERIELMLKARKKK